MAQSALDAIMACLVRRQGLTLTELASETSLPEEVVSEVVGFLVRYDLARIEPSSSRVILRDGEMSPHILAMIFETILSRDSSLCLRWS